VSRASHNFLNTVLPVSVRTLLRRGAVALIPSMRHLDMPFRLAALARNGFSPRVIFDIGAARGDWSRLAARVWPEARLFAFEPNRREEAALRRLTAELPCFEHRIVFLGAQSRTVRYSDSGHQTSVLAGEGDQVAEMRTLDGLIAEERLPAPDLLKLDVQGYELEVLRGGERALAGAEASLLEVSFLPFLPGMPLAAEVISFMESRGLSLYDVVGILRRPSDDALLQMDLLFLRSDHPLRRPGDT
jgi:FkbM family methyltransferase